MKRNYILGVINGTLVNFGMAFIDPYAVLPVFILRLGGSELVIGLTSAISGGGWYLPQVFISRLAESRRYLINLYRATAALRIAGWFGVALSVCLLDPARRGLYLAAFVAFYLVANLGAGLAAVPFLEIVGKTIPVTNRGAFFGTRRFIGGVLGVFAGILIGVILDTQSPMTWMGDRVFSTAERVASGLGFLGYSFPINYGFLFIIGGTLISIAMIAFCFVGEPPSEHVRKPEKLFDHLLSGFRILRDDQNYRLFYAVRICWQFTAMAFPFYSSYAVMNLHFPEGAVGMFVSLWVGSGVFSNYVWGRLMDGRGNKVVLQSTALLSMIPPSIVLFLDVSGGGAPGLSTPVFVAMASTFFINGFIHSGRVISNMTYLLEAAPIEKRILYTGFMNSFTFPFMLSPALGGLILHFSTISALFSLALLFALLNLILSFRLREPRTANTDSKT
ncbi:MAG: MFS transporter [Chitinivibrionia bacterium]|nr:MFS transporter [Chitinivibrionia bacterium]